MPIYMPEKFAAMPLFLKHVTLTAHEACLLEPHMGNWLRAHTYIQTFKPDAEGVAQMEKMLVWEICRIAGTRRHMLQRLRGRFINLRNQYEGMQLYKVLEMYE